ncbi:uncharacterized protein LOC112550101 [Alligator sinensis]|uniref:Uncharacterized protein LOC112550101 n=1 Tax=Alligator sinensis TaxID=38654 RepID=A0A3Q0GJL5_ALLSI|nr:uncharacterized protein LOC112550101 [Alligator sinensis]XP_025058510.1 uncharacterized protein LOC112550101 [Alligator sinensis]
MGLPGAPSIDKSEGKEWDCDIKGNLANQQTVDWLFHLLQIVSLQGHWEKLSSLDGDTAMESLLQVLPAKPTGRELLTLLDAVGQRKGQVLVMEMDDTHERVSPVRVAFAQELFSRADLGTELLQDEASKEREQELRPQLVFMLWQAATLRQLVQWELLDETLGNLRSLFPALVLVLIQPGLRHQQVEPEQAAGVLRRMQCLLDSNFQDLVVEAAVYSPGQLEGAWEVRRAACRALGEVLMEREEIASRDPVAIRLGLEVCNVSYGRQ